MQSFFRSLSATASDDNVVSGNKEEARDIIQDGEGKKAAKLEGSSIDLRQFTR